MGAHRVVLVTGAAGGIGRAVCERFLATDFAVVALDIDPTVEDLRSLSDVIVPIVADHTDLGQLSTVVDAARSLGELCHVATFAGVGLPQEIHHNDETGLIHPELFRSTLDTNLIGHANVIWTVQKTLFQTSGDRSITLCSSVNALQAWGEPGYSTAKAGLIGLVKSLAGSFGRQGVRINALAPGTIDSSGAQQEYADDPNRFDRMRASVPLGRLGQVADVADAALALARDLRHMHGAVMVLDGGQTVDNSTTRSSFSD